MKSFAPLTNNKVVLLFPAVLGLFLYLNIYVSSFFSGLEYFSWTSILLNIIKLYVFWFISVWIFNRSDRQSAISFIYSIITITIISAVFSAVHKQYLIYSDPQNDTLSWVHFVNYATEGVIAGLAITLLALLVHTMKAQQEILIKNANLEKANIKAQLHALQTQVNPHFLFNNLNTLQSMISEDNLEAQNYLKILADLFREMLNNRDVELVSLEQELEFSRLFIDLLKGRFKDNLEVHFKLQNTREYHVPPFTLQMLLENVIKHNRLDHAHRIEIMITQADNVLLVQNNCHPKHKEIGGNGIGLENLRRRYDLLSEKSIQIKEGNNFRVTIPLLKVKQHD